MDTPISTLCIIFTLCDYNPIMLVTLYVMRGKDTLENEKEEKDINSGKK